MKITLNDKEKSRIMAVDDAFVEVAKQANTYTQALRGLIVRRNAEIASVLRDHGILDGEIKKMDLESGELEISNIKKASREELAKLERRGVINEDQRGKIIRAKK